MLSIPNVRPATTADIRPLTDDLRPADILEIRAASGAAHGDAIRQGVGLGALVACLPNGLPAALFGVTTSWENSDIGLIWMVATNGFWKLTRQFLRESYAVVDHLGVDYRVVMNYSDARNTAHHRWLRWAGFTIIKRHEQFGVEQRPFLEFAKITERP